jgi:AcrR family transcriptional regulator
MAGRVARTEAINSALPKGRKGTQRERILNGMVAAANREGYAGASVSAVIEQAGVSRPTFYDYFADRDECFLATITDIHQRLMRAVAAAVEQQPPEHAIRTSITAILAFAGEQPARAHFLMHESMAGGPRALDTRDEGLAELQRIIEDAHRQVPPATAIPDIPPAMLIGGTYRMLAPRLRRGEPDIPGLTEDLVRWSERYARPAGKRRWSILKPSPPPPPSPFLPEPQPPPRHLGPGRPGLSKEEVAANHRERILYAAAQLAETQGYTATTIADLTRSAGIDGRAFYALFLDKQEAFMAVHEIGVQQVLNVTASAFFSGENWPERIWEAARAFTQFLEAHRLVTHVGFVEAHAVGPGASQRVQDSHSAFSIFLQEGYLHVTNGPPPSPAAVEAIVTTIFEIIYHQARASAKPKISGMAGHMTFLCLAPFLGATEANRFAEKKTSERRKKPARRPPAAAGSRSSRKP